MNSAARKVMNAIRVTLRLCRLSAELMMAACRLVIHGAKAALKRPHSKRFASEEASDAARQRLECGRLSAAFPQAVSSTNSHHRALWLHHLCRRLLPIFGVELNVTGPVPARGLLIANHLSYLDIIVLASRTPCVFVAKSEVKSWPVFGWFAQRAGTIFINRRSRRDAVRATEVIRAALDEGALVVLFPEGTSSSGATVRMFKSSLLEAAQGQTPSSNPPRSISVAALNYELSDGEAAQDVCYWGDHTLVPHLLKLLSKRRVRASVSFARVQNTWRDRKKLAVQLHEEVTALHTGLRLERSAGLRGGVSASALRAGSETSDPLSEPTAAFTSSLTSHLQTHA